LNSRGLGSLLSAPSFGMMTTMSASGATPPGKLDTGLPAAIKVTWVPCPVGLRPSCLPGAPALMYPVMSARV
jgi:hypothetical protein